MAVEHTLAELETTWWDMLKKIVFTLNWDYAALWTRTADGRNLVWKQGYYYNRMRSTDDAIAELFYSLYSKCIFTHGVGFAGHAVANMTNSILWLTRDDMDRLENPVANQTKFLNAAQIQTVVCLPLGPPMSSFVLELGTVNWIRETDEWANTIKKLLQQMLASGMPNPMVDNSMLGLSVAPERFQGPPTTQGRPSNPPRALTATTAMPMASASAPIMEPTVTTSAPSFSQSPGFSFGGEMLLRSQRQLQSSIYSELMHPIEQSEDPYAMPMARNSVSQPMPNPRERLMPDSPWATDSSLLQMEMSPFHNWAETTTSLETTLQEMGGVTSSGSSSHLATELEILDLKNEEGDHQMQLPFASTALDQFMATAPADQQQLLMTGSRRGSSSRSSVSRRSQTVEDTAISAAIRESYPDRPVSELESSSQRTHVVSASTTAPVDSEGYWRSTDFHRSSEPSSKETSPESNMPVPRFGQGIHPRITLQKQQPQQQQQQQQQRFQSQSMRQFEHRGAGSSGARPSGSTTKEPAPELLERQHSSSPARTAHRPQQEEITRSAPSTSAEPEVDTSPRLVQFGNVLQLGGPDGQVREAPPHEHDEAAVSHMMAERRRRIKQNENFNQLKYLIPTAAKMDKASILAATITYIHELKDRVRDLEETNLKLRQMRGLDQEQGTSSLEVPLSNIPARGSPTRPASGVRSPTSPPDSDRIQASPDGDGNLKIEIRRPCAQPDAAMHIFGCLREMHYKVLNANVALNGDRIYATIIVKTKRKNMAGLSAVCDEVELALATCLNNLS